MNSFKLGFAAAASAVMMAATAFASDLTVDYGQSVTIDANATYDTVTVNGDLVVAQGVTLTCSYFFVSQNNSGHRATVTPMMKRSRQALKSRKR